MTLKVYVGKRRKVLKPEKKKKSPFIILCVRFQDKQTKRKKEKIALALAETKQMSLNKLLILKTINGIMRVIFKYNTVDHFHDY
jgi:hypothetical protein